jgi:CYTH domain-containing protein
VATEIERKFLVLGSDWKRGAVGTPFRQGYLSTVKERVVRVRTEGPRGVLTIKGINQGTTRTEFEYVIPVADANALLDGLCERPLLEKTRYRMAFGGLVWEVDEFHGDNEGLVVAEVELVDAAQAVQRPPWLGREVSDVPRYYNSNLVLHPFRTWMPERST